MAAAWRRSSRYQEAPTLRSPGPPWDNVNSSDGVTLDDVWKVMSGIVTNIQELKEEVRNNGRAIREMEEKLDGVLSVRKKHASCSGVKVPGGLSAAVRQVHRQLGEDLQWKVGPNDCFRSKHNEQVTKSVTEAIKDSGDAWGPDSLLRKACNRYFENLKSQKKLDLEGTTDVSKRKKTLTSRRDRLFKKRVKVGREILSQDDFDHLLNADPNFMSDEESDEDDKGVFIVKPPRWREKRLTAIVQQCQQVLDENRRTGVMPCTSRPRKHEGFSAREAPAAQEKQKYVEKV
ncbi:hypothetical protein AMEX_G17886 [Astyanax mexicanus]|uniref:Uncharacterized protein n=3 Tax=Astyanax mexicanus TaxID=7994 RepID=A0A8T2LB32_ASTMX|nr:hypothetical protein AMEX_G17886 [Astyanax mexicanus]